MAPKRPKNNSFHSRRQHKRKKFNVITLRQKNDFKSLGESHPADTEDKVKSYTKVEDRPEKEEDNPSSSESEEDIPVLKQLLDVIGVKEEEPESEQEEDSSDEEEEAENSEEELVNDCDKSEGSDVEESAITMEESSEPKGNCEKGLPKKNYGLQFIDDEAEEVENDSENEGEGGESDDFIVDDNSNDGCSEKEDESGESEDGDDFFETDEDKDDEVAIEKNLEIGKHKQSKFHELEMNVGNKSLKKSMIEKGGTENNDDLNLEEPDPFSQHFEIEIEETDLKGESLRWDKKELKVPGIGKGLLLYKHPHHLAEIKVKSELRKMHVKQKLCDQLVSVNKKLSGQSSKSTNGLSVFQHKLFGILNSYQDLMYPMEDFRNMEEIRLVYCLHALNHVLKTRSRIIAHNTKIKNKDKKALDDIEYRDQGLTRPKVLILLPYRDRALRVYKMILSLLSAFQEIKASSRKRFETEFSEIEKREVAGKKYKSKDFIKMFEGNVDDNFRVGINISKKSLRLYSPFYESDIILASPLGLRTVIGNEGDTDRDFDFLSSIEVLIMDQTDVFLMQNWDHVSHIFKHLHLQPKEAHGTDFSRVRMWAIDGLSKYFRQTVILSSVLSPEIQTIFNKHCHRKLLIQRDTKNGTIGSCLSDSAQIFHCVPCDKPDGMTQRNAKLDYMKKKIIPHHTSRGMNQTLIYCNYFNFVLLRNYFREADVDFLFINEYDSEKNISKTRINFRKKSPHFMLYTERLHFHHRFRLKGIHHIVWFDVPQYPNFYPEIVNLMEVTQQACTSTCLFTKYDGQKLLEIVGQKRAAHIMNSDKSVHMITVS